MICLADTCDRYCWTFSGISENNNKENKTDDGIVFVRLDD